MGFYDGFHCIFLQSDRYFHTEENRYFLNANRGSPSGGKADLYLSNSDMNNLQRSCNIDEQFSPEDNNQSRFIFRQNSQTNDDDNLNIDNSNDGNYFAFCNNNNNRKNILTFFYFILIVVIST